MEHYWRSIEGYFTFPDFYEWIAREWSWEDKPRHLVEMGVFRGQSVAFLGVELINRGVNARFDLVDMHADQIDRRSYEPLGSLIGTIHHATSVAAAATYADKSLDLVFIDGEHTYGALSQDISAWRGKVKSGGILAGHDFTLEFPGVIQAVCETFPRVELWRGVNDGGNAPMQGKYWPVWAVRVA